MKSIRCWDDLSAYGIIPLTGEACGLSYRILCDVTARGKKTLEKALSVAQLGLHENWNHGSADDPHVGSVMLAPDLLPFIGVFALLEAGCREVWLTKGQTVIGIEAEDSPDQRGDVPTLSTPTTWRDASATAGTAGDRNQHMMTGRVV